MRLCSSVDGKIIYCWSIWRSKEKNYTIMRCNESMKSQRLFSIGVKTNLVWTSTINDLWAKMVYFPPLFFFWFDLNETRFVLVMPRRMKSNKKRYWENGERRIKEQIAVEIVIVDRCKRKKGPDDEHDRSEEKDRLRFALAMIMGVVLDVAIRKNEWYSFLCLWNDKYNE